MAIRAIALLLSLIVLAQTGCKCSRSRLREQPLPPAPPAIVPANPSAFVPATPPAAAPATPPAAAPLGQLPAFDPDHQPAQTPAVPASWIARSW